MHPILPCMLVLPHYFVKYYDYAYCDRFSAIDKCDRRCCPYVFDLQRCRSDKVSLVKARTSKVLQLNFKLEALNLVITSKMQSAKTLLYTINCEETSPTGSHVIPSSYVQNDLAVK